MKAGCLCTKDGRAPFGPGKQSGCFFLFSLFFKAVVAAQSIRESVSQSSRFPATPSATLHHFSPPRCSTMTTRMFSSAGTCSAATWSVASARLPARVAAATRLCTVKHRGAELPGFKVSGLKREGERRFKRLLKATW